MTHDLDIQLGSECGILGAPVAIVVADPAQDGCRSIAIPRIGQDDVPT
jgi:hypothetical protein